MPVLTDKNKAELKARFAQELEGQVTLRHFTQRTSQLVLPGGTGAPQTAQGSQFLRQAREILEELAAAAPDKIKLEVYDLVAERAKLVEYRVAHIPCTLLDSEGRSRYYGVPAGYEFTTLVQAVIDTSKGRTPLHEPTLKVLRELDQDVNLKVFVTPT
ncbi:MAG: hypothetical protein EXR60_02800 [Dehalococcoidia bacterium]|nr:hypothetical protein [Dehalococcoidia bacterium]